jgi:undecaprenyl-diphosphatase
VSDPSLTYPEAIVIGLLQGVTELFPVSSLGHSVLIPAVIGGRWARDLSLAAEGSPYLAFLIAVHVATAFALVVFFRHDWLRIIKGLATSLRDRRIDTPDQRLAWLLIAATIPVGLAGLALEHTVRTSLGKPLPAALFLILNGVLLASVERLRRQSAPGPMPVPVAGEQHERGRVYVASSASRGADGGVSAGQHGDVESDRRLAGQSWGQALLIGAAQILDRRLLLAAVPHPVLRDAHAHAVRYLLRPGRTGQPRLDRRALMRQAGLTWSRQEYCGSKPSTSRALSIDSRVW